MLLPLAMISILFLACEILEKVTPFQHEGGCKEGGGEEDSENGELDRATQRTTMGKTDTRVSSCDW